MNDTLTPEALAELRRMLGAATPGPWEWTTDLDALLGGQEGEYRVIDTAMALRSYYVLRVASEDAALIAAAINALPALLGAAAFLDEVRAQVARGALCPMCSTGMTRQTVGMACQLCGTDYGSPEYSPNPYRTEETDHA